MGVCGCKQLPGDTGQITITAKQKEDTSTRKTEERDGKSPVKSREEEYIDGNPKQSTHLDNAYSNHKVNATGIDEKIVTVKKVEELNQTSIQPEYYMPAGIGNKNIAVKETNVKNEYREPLKQEVIKETKVYKEEQE